MRGEQRLFEKPDSRCEHGFLTTSNDAPVQGLRKGWVCCLASVVYNTYPINLLRSGNQP
jgi:hypothetical protein